MNQSDQYLQLTESGAAGGPGPAVPGPVEEELRLSPVTVTPQPRPGVGVTAGEAGLVMTGPATTRNVSQSQSTDDFFTIA